MREVRSRAAGLYYKIKHENDTFVKVETIGKAAGKGEISIPIREEAAFLAAFH